MAVILYHAEQGHLNAHLLQKGLHSRHMPLAAIQQDEVRQAAEALGLPFLLAGTVLLKPAADDFPHGTIVILALHCLDLELPVGGFQGAAVFKHHHARHIFPAGQVGDVIALDIGRGLFQPQQPAQFIQGRGVPPRAARLPGNALRSILAAHLHQLRLVPLWGTRSLTVLPRFH